MGQHLTVSEVIAEYLIRSGVEAIVGLPGHGILAFVDALLDRRDRIKILTVKHEQAAAHLADGYFRARGLPLAVFTSVGPGAMNTIVGAATAHVDGSSMLLFTSEPPTYMFERGAIQAVEQQSLSDFTNVMRPVVGRSWLVTNPRQILDILPRALGLTRASRAGVAHIALPMDVQALSVECDPERDFRFPVLVRAAGDPSAIEEAAELLVAAQRPMILCGGGVISSGASDNVVELAEFLGIPVITTLMGKGAIPEDHDLALFYAGSKGSTCGFKTAQEADVILALGCRFAEWTCGSYRRGMPYSIPPQKLIHVDVDETQIGRNYPTEVGIAGDLHLVVPQLLEAIRSLTPARDYRSSDYFAHLQELKREWEAQLEGYRKDTGGAMTTSRFLWELRRVLDRKAIVLGAAGHAQAQLFQEFPAYGPRTHISTGAFSTMGFCIPAGIGAKLAQPDRTVVSISGDGDFLMTGQEIATAVQYGVPALFVVLNNFGWLSIRDLQIHLYGEDRIGATEFIRPADGQRYNPDFVAWAKAFGCPGERVERPEDVAGAVERGLSSGGPAVIEVLTAIPFPESEGAVVGFSDLPTPKTVQGETAD